MSDEDLEERLGAALPALGNLSAVVKFDLAEDGRWLVDARTAPPVVSRDEGDADADCVIQISGQNLLKLLDGRLDPMLAYGMGKIKVRGSMGVAMKLVAAIG